MQKLLYPLIQKSMNFCLLPMKKEPPIDMKKNVELLAEEREGLKYILPAVKLRYTEGESSYGQF